MNIISITNNSNFIVNNKNNNNTAVKNFSYNNKINFGSAKSDKAVKLLDSAIDTLIEGSEFNIANKMKFHSILKEAMPSILRPENYINKGRDSKVYRISDKYVAKIRRGYYENNAVGTFSVVSMPNNKFKKLDFYYGEPVAKTGKVEILKNATPTSDNIQCGAHYHTRGNASSVEEIKEYEETFIPKCSEVPQESFDDLAKNIKELNTLTCRNKFLQKRSYVPDIINPNNLIISDNKFILVDELEKVPFKNPNSIYTMLEPILIRLTPETYAPKNPKLLKNRVNIFKKILLASEKHDLPLDSPIKYEFSDWTLGNIMGEYDILDQVKNMRKEGIPKQTRMNAIKTFFEEHPVQD